MTIALSTIQSTWGGSSAPINLSSYYQGGSLIGPNVRGGGSIPSSGTINEGAFVGALNQYNWGRNQYINGDQSNDGMGYSMDYYYNPRTGKYCLTFNFGAMSAGSPNAAYLTYLNTSAPTFDTVYSLALPTIGVTVYTNNSTNYVQGNSSWINNFPGGWIANATLNVNNTVSLNYNSGASSGDSGTNYALARQRDAWLAMFGSYSYTYSVPV